MSEESSRVSTPLALPVVRSILAADGLTAHVLSRYDLPDPVRCDLFSRADNDTYAVRAGTARYFLRVYSSWREEDAVQAEIDMLRYLQQAHMPISFPLPRQDGRYLTRIAAPEGERYACLFSNAEGKATYMTPESSRAYGALVATIHTCLDDRPMDPRRFHLDLHHLVDEPLACLRDLLGEQTKAYTYFDRVGRALGSQIEDRLPKEKPLYGSCHGDHHGANTHIADDGTITVFDFDCYGYGWRAYDLAVFLWSQHKNWGWGPDHRDGIEQRWTAFRDGYETVRALSPHEREAIEMFVPLRQLWTLGKSFRKVGILGHKDIGRGFLEHSIRFIGSALQTYELTA